MSTPARIEFPNRSKWWEPRLLWLMDNQPRWTEETFLTKRLVLQNALTQMVERATNYEERLKASEEGYYPIEIEEMVMNLVAPPDELGVKDPRPISEKMRLQILGWSQNLPTS